MTDTPATPEISVLVPIYNVERYLRECLDSLRAQTFTDFEVLCINDGSTDGSRAIIGEYLEADPRFKVIDKPNSGYGCSMNRGLSEAHGRYIAILESDDFIEPNTFEVLHGTAERYDAQVVKANCYFYWSVPADKNKLFELVPGNACGRLVNPQEEHDIFYLKPSIWSALYRRDFLEDNGIRFLETPGASYQDAGFNFKVWTSATRVVFLREAYLHYRQDNETSSVNSPGKVYCVCDEYAEMSRYLSERPEKKPWLDPVKTKMLFDSYMWNYERLAPELQEEFIQRFASDFKEHQTDGTLDLELFEPWKRLDLQTIVTDPLLYHAQRTNSGAYSRFGKMRHYYRIGGLPLLAKIARKKLFK
jgi:glycosyltransferase involved in cell wall biosynthesis